MAGRNISNPTTYATLSSGTAQQTSLFDGSFSPLYGVVTDSGNWANYGVDTGSANAYVVTLTPAAASYENGMILAFQPVNSNTGASTINVNGLGSKSIVNAASLALNGGEISANAICTVMYDGTNFRIIGPCPLSVIQTGLSTTFSKDCAGFTSINLQLSWSSGAMPITLLHVAQGVPISIFAVNAQGVQRALSFTGCTNPAGTAITTINGLSSGTVNGGSFIDLIAAGFLVNAGKAIGMNGSADGPTQILLAM
jgi:hypothetical protein